MHVPNVQKIEQKKRSQEGILYEIVNECYTTPCLKTRIMYRCNLGFKQLNDYLEKAKKGNYIAEKIENEKTYYETQEKGKAFLTIYDLLFQLLNTGNNKDPYNDTRLKNEIQNALSSLTSTNRSFKTQRFPKVNVFDFKYRDKYFVIEDILNAAIGGIKKTQIMHRCNLSFDELKKYLKMILKANMVEVKTIDKKTTEFVTTDKGKIFIELHGLETYLLETGREQDPFKDEKLITQIETALSPLLSIKVPVEAYITTPESVKQEKIDNL